MKENFKAHLALLSVAIIYGLNYSIAKDVLVKGYMSPSAFIALRVTAATLLFSIFHFIFIREKMERRDIIYAAMCSLFGVVINMLAFFEGLKFTSPIHASLIMVLTPMLVLVASALILKEKVTNNKVIGIFFGLVGAVLLISSTSSVNNKISSVYGDMMVMINAISYGLYLVLVRRLIKKYHPITVIKWVFFFGCFITVPLAWTDLMNIAWQTFEINIWLAVGYVLLFTTFLTYLGNAYALSKVMPSTVGFYIYFQPLIAAAFAILMGMDSLNGYTICATIILFISIYFINKSSSNSNKTV